MKTKYASEIRHGLNIGRLVTGYGMYSPGLDPRRIRFYTLARSRTARKARDRVIERQEKRK